MNQLERDEAIEELLETKITKFLSPHSPDLMKIIQAHYLRRIAIEISLLNSTLEAMRVNMLR